MLTKFMLLWMKLKLESKVRLERMRAIMLGRTTHFAFRTRRMAHSHRAKVEIAVWMMGVAAGAVLVRPFQSRLNSLISKDEFEKLQDIVVATSGAMVGATAIVTSFILFAMQVNVERLPYGLFSRFSSDWKLLSTFGIAFVLAIGGTSLSLVTDPDYAALVIVLGVGTIAVILRLLLQAYRRSLTLINPISQLAILTHGISKEIRQWNRRVRWLSPLLPIAEKEQDAAEARLHGPQIDIHRATILRMNQGWDRNLRTAISQAVAFSRQAGERGDLEVSAEALNAVIRLNELYVRMKGRTFHANSLLIDNPLVSDGTINDTLEHLRRLRRLALARSDEQHLEQLFRTYLALTGVYLRIEYPGTMPSHSHALLAAGYLERSVEAAFPTPMTDTVMTGLCVLAEVGKLFMRSGDPTEAVGIIQKIGAIGSAGAIKPDSLPITLTAVEQLAQLQLALFLTQENDPSYATRQLRETVFMTAKVVLTLPDTPLLSSHSRFLGPVFSSTSIECFRSSMTTLVNQLNNAGGDDKMAETVARNIEAWADQLYVGTRELLGLAIEKRTHFTFDMIHWITGMSEILFTAAHAPATAQHTREKLEKHANWLFSSLTFIPRDRDTAQWIENFSFIEDVFRFAMMAARREWEDGFDSAWDLLLRWGFEAGREQTGWNTLESSLAALAALALRRGNDQRDLLFLRVRAAVAADGAPSQDTLDHTARELREKGRDIRQRDFDINPVTHALAQIDEAGARALLIEIANVLSPGTADEPVRFRHF